MLSFDSSLSNALQIKNTTAFWVVKLYYNDESNFIGLSDIDRPDGDDMYHGLISSWGNLSQSLDFFNFTTTSSNLSIKIINSDKSILGGRFSDLLSTFNFSNRKWELFLNTNQASTFDTANRMIATGSISGDIKYDFNSLDLVLTDLESIRNKKIPSSSVTVSSFPNAPEKNIGKPIPISYGDFYEKDDIGTIPTGNFDKFKQFYKSAFPAIITDKFDIGEASVEANVDSQSMHTLDNENVYYYKSSLYSTITGSTPDATTNNPKIQFSGSRLKVFIPLSSSGFTTSGDGTHINETNISNLNFSDSSKTTLFCDAGGQVTVNYAVPTTTKLGEFVGINALVKLGTVTGNFSNLNTFLVGNQAFSPLSSVTSNAELTVNLASAFSGDTSSWNFEGLLPFKVLAGQDTTPLSVEIIEAGVVVEYDIDNIETHKIEELVETVRRGGASEGIQRQRVNHQPTITTTRTTMINTPAEIEYIYVSGKGRKFGSWVDSDSRNNGYNQNDLIENPVYIVEDILRTELGLNSSNIDYSTFDLSGNTTNGEISKPFDDAVSDIKFSFSQYKFINSLDLISRVSKQMFSYVWMSGNGKFKIRTLLKPSDTFTVDKTIDFLDIDLKNIRKTELNTVRNNITVSYNYDYGQKQNLETVNVSDSTSEGTTVNGNNQSLKLNLDAEGIIDSTTADKLANGYKNLFKDRKTIIEFDVFTPRYNDLEITDHIQFTNWDDNLKIYGTAYNSDFFMITEISKTPEGCYIQAIKVDE